MKHYKLVLGLCLSALLAACSFEASKPTVILTSPASGAQYQAGDQVQIQSSSANSSGIVRVELFVDGNLIRFDTAPGGQPQVQLNVVQLWNANGEGIHRITVRATNANGATGEAAINLNVQGQVAQISPTPTGAITNIPLTEIPLPSVTDTTAPSTPTNTTVPPTSATPTNTSGRLTPTNTNTPCTNNSQFIADVTIPDGTTLAAGSTFVKTWRVLNSGSCAYDGGYTIVRIGGEQLGAPSPNVIPAAAPGTVIDISLSMFAPAAPGPHSGAWRLRASDGTFFGTNLTVVINVPGAPTATRTPETSTNTPTRTATSTPTRTRTPTPTPTPTTAPAVSVTQGSLNILAHQLGTVHANCPAGTRVTGGGYIIKSTLYLDVYGSSSNGFGWSVAATNTSGSTQGLYVNAICVSGVPGTTTQVEKQISIAAGVSATNTAACPAGSTVTGGGFYKQVDLELYTMAQFGNGWQTIVKNNGASNQLSNSYAICYNGAGASSTRVQTQVTLAANAEGFAVVSCPDGTLVTGGGFGTFLGATAFLLGKSESGNGNGWQAGLKNTTGSSKPLIVYATCVDFP